MVDERRVRRLLQRIADDLAFLESRSGGDRSEIVADADRLAAIKYVFVTVVEACVSVAQHLCASEGWGPPTSNAEAVRLLARHDVVPGPVAETVARAVGFRNVLVHRYVEVSDAHVVAFLDHVPELREFVASIAQWADRA